MQYTPLGRTGTLVSRLCLGTMNFGWIIDQAESFAIMDRALELGINFFDTANVYGLPLGAGLTEELLGRWFAQGGGRREKVVLATKVYGPMGPWPLERGHSALHVRRACDGSLRRMGVETIDLYQMHHIDRGKPSPFEKPLFDVPYTDHLWRVDHGPTWEETWQAMEQLTAAGKIIYAGSSNFAAWNIAQANEIARARHFLGLVCEQSKYSLACRAIELEVVPVCRAMGLGIIPWSPVHGGMLAGALEKSEGVRRGKLAEEQVARHRPQLAAYEALCRELGHDPAQIALAWLLHQDAVTAPIIGPRTVQQLESCVAALAIELDAAALAKLDAIWPGPGGQAPDAYAW